MKNKFLKIVFTWPDFHLQPQASVDLFEWNSFNGMTTFIHLSKTACKAGNISTLITRETPINPFIVEDHELRCVPSHWLPKLFQLTTTHSQFHGQCRVWADQTHRHDNYQYSISVSQRPTLFCTFKLPALSVALKSTWTLLNFSKVEKRLPELPFHSPYVYFLLFFMNIKSTRAYMYMYVQIT